MADRHLEQFASSTFSPMHEIGRGDSDYPSRLNKLTDPPHRLFVRGTLPSGPMVAIVGSRNADSAAQRFAFRLAFDLTKQGITVVSGGALGVDTSAHNGALDATGPTVSIIGSGFNHMYPRENKTLFKKISRQGALVTEFAPEQPPTTWTFPKRNRLVAAIASAVVVVQAGAKSGALITASLAKKLNVPVGSVPGNAGDFHNRGSNQLIKNGAVMVESSTDVLDMMMADSTSSQLGLPGIGQKQANSKRLILNNFSINELKVLDILGSSPIHIDEICASTGLEIRLVSAAILTLELSGVIEDQGGKNFVAVD
jgi:DNA processing protein